MTSLCIANGPWQLIMLEAARRQARPAASGEDCLVAYYHRSLGPELVAVMDEIRAALPAGAFSRRIYLHETLSVAALRQSWSWRNLVRQVQTNVGLDDVGEIWMTSLADWPEGAIACAFPDARVVQYEDGLSSYFEGGSSRDPGISPASFTARMQLVARRLQSYFPCRNPGAIWSAMKAAGALRSRCRERHLFLSNWLEPHTDLPDAVCSTIRASTLRGLLEDLSATLVSEQDRLAATAMVEKSAVVIAQNFSDGNQLDRASEEQVYRTAVQCLWDGGYHVYWKEHPRAKKPFLPDLVREFPGRPISAYPFSSRLPIELTVGMLPSPPVFVGALSTSLFYLRYIFNCRVCQFAGLIAPRLTGAYARMAAQVARALPSVTEAL